jgi:hypothetical protein
MATAWLPLETYVSDHEMASQCLAGQLQRGTLGLFLGSGVSHDMGVPFWWELVRDCRNACRCEGKPIDEKTSSEDLRLAMDVVQKAFDSTDDYLKLMREQLYKGFSGERDLLKHDLLISLGALIMKSRRGSCTDVVTLNFDDVLERYLRLRGFLPETIQWLPKLRGYSDVEISHPHGFVPSSPALGAPSNFLVFSECSYEERFAEHGPWWNLTLDMLLRKLMLFVGLSVRDPLVRTVLRKVQAELGKAGDPRPTGFWLLGPSDPEPEAERILTNRNIVPIRRDDYQNEYPRFLLDICCRAAGALQ